ncbi:MAG TPA: helix-turn-helix domain-containing protein [Lichenihabitans sp.]|nr:helix-turn-helix domain-containing protein [Lichenihabitans sp.]
MSATTKAGAPSRPTPKSAGTRARIVAGALRALETHGLDATTTRRIAAEADVRLATLHYHFDGKEALLLAVLDTLVAELVATLAAAATAGATLDERIAAGLDAAWAYAGRTRAKQIVQYELTLYALRSRGSEWLAARQYRAYVDAYAALLRLGDTPEPTDAQAQELARLMLAGIDGLILQALAGAPDADLAAALDALTAGVTTHAATLLRQHARSRERQHA